jgi:hypothetical protein
VVTVVAKAIEEVKVLTVVLVAVVAVLVVALIVAVIVVVVHSNRVGVIVVGAREQM